MVEIRVNAIQILEFPLFLHPKPIICTIGLVEFCCSQQRHCFQALYTKYRYIEQCHNEKLTDSHGFRGSNIHNLN